MKKLHRILIAASLAAAGTLAAQTTSAPAGGGPHRGHGGPRHGVHPIIRVLDADHDGEISAAELANAPAAIRALDTNGDGVVSREELFARPADAPARPAPPADAPARPTPPAGADHPRPADPIMLALDANCDGSLSATEIANASTSLATLDLNKDGKLTRDELRPLPPAN